MYSTVQYTVRIIMFETYPDNGNYVRTWSIHYNYVCLYLLFIWKIFCYTLKSLIIIMGWKKNMEIKKKHYAIQVPYFTCTYTCTCTLVVVTSCIIWRVWNKPIVPFIKAKIVFTCSISSGGWWGLFTRWGLWGYTWSILLPDWSFGLSCNHPTTVELIDQREKWQEEALLLVFQAGQRVYYTAS